MTAILNAIEAELLKTNLVKANTWATEMAKWGAKITLYRNYIDGNHRHDYTTEMAQMLRVDKEDEESFTINYQPIVVNKLVDRLHIEKIEASGDNEAGNEWIAGVLEASNFDELQIDVTSDCVGDGDTFAMIDPPKKADTKKGTDDEPMKFIHEPAWDNISGIIPVYDNRARNLVAIVKVWQDLTLDKDRVNIYYDDRIEKFVHDGGLVPFTVDDSTIGDEEEGISSDSDNVIQWVGKDGKPLGIPFEHYRNRKKTRRSLGESEIQKTIAAQDVLNRTFVSMTMTSELTAFQRLLFIGMKADVDISPGSAWEAVAKDTNGNDKAGISKDLYVDVKVIPPGEIAPFVEQAQFTIEQISVVSETPIPSVMGGDSQSGEALKQREVGLVAKARTAQIVIGNVWGNLIMKAAKVEEAFGTKPPEFEKVTTLWAEINTRDNELIVDNAIKVEGQLDQETMLKEIEPAMAFTVEDIPTIMDAKNTVIKKEATAERRKSTLLARQQAQVPRTPAQVETEQVVDLTPPPEPETVI